MNRAIFLGGVAAAVALRGSVAEAAGLLTGSTTTQAELFGSLPKPKDRDWTRMILGSGAVYQKQIGAGIEVAATGEKRPYYELQVGSPGGSCNPNSLRKAYLRSDGFGSLLEEYSLISNIGRAANLVFRYGDITSTEPHSTADDVKLRLLDEKFLYDARPLRIVSIARERIHVASREVETTHVVGEFGRPKGKHERLRRIELWHTPFFPFGVAKYRATLAGLEPYELHVYAAGTSYVSDLPMPLDRIREITKDGQYGAIPVATGT